jgi:signal transduction histidine kinase
LTQVGELQEIASEFSTYSRIPKIEPRQGNLVEVVERIVAAYRPVSADDVRVRLLTSTKVVEGTFDAKLVGRAVRNLLENALRATLKGGQVDVAVEESAGEARIVVGDDGPGVEESLLTRIFDPYFSTHDAGTGLGLPIAKRIAEEHGGEIAARNRESGGLEVTITLPTV